MLDRGIRTGRQGVGGVAGNKRPNMPARQNKCLNRPAVCAQIRWGITHQLQAYWRAAIRCVVGGRNVWGRIKAQQNVLYKIRHRVNSCYSGTQGNALKTKPVTRPAMR